MMRLIIQLNHWLLTVAGWGVILAMGIIACVIPYEVFARYITGSMPVWSGEAATFALVWATMLGSPLALARGYQVGITYVMDKLPAALAKTINIFMLLMVLAFLILMLVYGILQTETNLRQVSPAMAMPMAVPYLAVPAGFLLMICVTLEQLLRLFCPGSPEGDSSCC